MATAEGVRANVPVYASVSLYVGDLHPDTTEAELHEKFATAGQIASIRLCRDSATRRSLGYGYVNFQDTESAERAISTLNFSKIHNRECRVCWSQSDATQRRSGSGNLYVKNLPATMDNLTFQQIFSKFGDIVSSKVSVDMKTGQCLSYGFVNFESEDVAKTVIAASPIDFNGVQLVVMPFKSQKERGAANAAFTNVYAKDFPESWTEEQLNKHFTQFGAITSSKVVVSEHPTSTGRKFGFVNFTTHEEAQNAIEQSSVVEVEGKKLYVVRAQTKNERERQKKEISEARRVDRMQKYANCNLYIRALPETITDEQFKEVFGKVGTIVSSRVTRTEEGRATSVAYVCYASAEEATKAIAELNQSTIFGAPLMVTYHQTKAARAQRQQYMRGPFPPHMNMNMMMVPHQYMKPMHPNGAPNGMYPMQMGVNGYMGGFPRGNRNMGRFNGNGPHGNNGPRGPRQGRPGQGPNGANRRPRAPQGHVASAPAQFDAATFAQYPPDQQRNYLGELLFPKVASVNQEQAPKITGMLIEMDHNEVIKLLHSDEELKAKINEAIEVLRTAEQQ